MQAVGTSATADTDTGAPEDVSARIAELEAVILTDRRILMGGGLQCPCPGCGPEDEGYDPWAPAPSRTAVGAFGVQPAQQGNSGVSHAEALNAEVTERLELNQLELAELRQRLSVREAEPVSDRDATAEAQGSDETTREETETVGR